MNIITTTDLRNLVSDPAESKISIYMPTEPSQLNGKQDCLRLRSLISSAEEQLIKRGVGQESTAELLRPISELPASSAWQHRKHGLAVFRSPQSFVTYWLEESVPERSVVSTRFSVRPLLRFVDRENEFYALVLSRKCVRLLKATRDGVEQVALKGISASMDEALNLQGADRGEQVHSGMRGDLGKEAAVFHGQGGHRDTIKDEVSEYFQLISKSLAIELRGDERPVVLAGIDYEVALFRRFCDVVVAPEALHGCFDAVSDQDVVEQARPIARRFFDDIRREPLVKYKSMPNRLLATDNLEEILLDAEQGKIEALLVDPRAEIIGVFNVDRGNVAFKCTKCGGEDLIERAIELTLRNRGAVYAGEPDELPFKASACAVLRYW